MGTYNGRLGGSSSGSGGKSGGGKGGSSDSVNRGRRSSMIDKIEERIEKGQNITQEEYDILQEYKGYLP